MEVRFNEKTTALTVLHLRGRLTVGAGASCLNDAVDALLEADIRNIVLNMQGVTSVDRAGMCQLVACHSKARAKGGRLELWRVDQRFRLLLKLLRIDNVFEETLPEVAGRSTYRLSCELPARLVRGQMAVTPWLEGIVMNGREVSDGPANRGALSE